MAELSTPRTFAVALVVAVCCAGLVAGTAVELADRIQANKDRERMARILASAGVADAGEIQMRVVELDSGRYVESEELGPGTFDQSDAAADPERSDPIPDDEDPAELERRERHAWVGLIHDDGRLARLVLPVRGRGYGGMIEGFVILDADGTTLRGIRFTEHDETPGLGSEITSESWRARFVGKRVYDAQGRVRIEVVPEGTSARAPDAVHRVDGISGATISSQAVSRLLRFWFGRRGFGPYLERIAGVGSGTGAREEEEEGSDG